MSEIHFQNPQWLWLMLAGPAVLALAIFRSRAELQARGKALSLAFRCLWICVCVAALAGPFISTVQTHTPSAHVYVLEDRSSSMSSAAEQTATLKSQFLTALGGDVKVHSLLFADGVWRENETAAEISHTDIESALMFANVDSLATHDVSVVVLSDGRSNKGDPIQAANALALRGARVHAIPCGQSTIGPTAVDVVRPPGDAFVGVATSLQVTLNSHTPVRARASLIDADGKMIDQRVLTLTGSQTLALHLTPKEEGLNRYKLKVDATDAQTGLTVAVDSKPVEITAQGPPRILVCDPLPEEMTAFVSAMAPLKLPVDCVTKGAWPRDLRRYAAIIISDWTGDELSQDNRDALRRYVEMNGGGLVFIGGNNVSPAAWRKTSIAELLPVVLKEDPAAMLRSQSENSVMFVVDRSGSMGEALGGGISKINLVKTAICDCVRTLPPKTQVAVISFDNSIDVLVPPTDVSQKEQIITSVNTLSARGGTVIGPPIQQGLAMLATMPGKRHMIVLTDGIGERPGSDEAYWGPIAEAAAKKHVSWTSVAVGADADQTLLSYLAKKTNGKYFFCDTGDKIPQVFLEQAKSIRRLAELAEKPFTPRAGPVAGKLKDLPPAQMPQLTGRIHSGSQPNIEIWLETDKDEPLLASWRFGLGNVVAFTSDAKQGWAGEWTHWKGFGSFWMQVVQSVLRPPHDLHARVRPHQNNNHLLLSAVVTDDQGKSVSDLRARAEIAAVPSLLIGLSPQSPTPTIRLEQLSSADFQAQCDLPEDGRDYSITLHFIRGDDEKHGIQYTSVHRSRKDLENAETGPDLGQLQALCEVGHGLLTTDVTRIADECRHVTEIQNVHVRKLWPILLMAALLMWPIDVLIRKFC